MRNLKFGSYMPKFNIFLREKHSIRKNLVATGFVESCRRNLKNTQLYQSVDLPTFSTYYLRKIISQLIWLRNGNDAYHSISVSQHCIQIRLEDKEFLKNGVVGPIVFLEDYRPIFSKGTYTHINSVF